MYACSVKADSRLKKKTPEIIHCHRTATWEATLACELRKFLRTVFTRIHTLPSEANTLRWTTDGWRMGGTKKFIGPRNIGTVLLQDMCSMEC